MPMTARRGRGERSRCRLAALALIAPLLAAGCATPHTHFTWEYADDGMAKPRPAAVRHVAAEKPRCICDSVPVPSPRPTPNADQQAAKPMQHEDVAQADRRDFAWPVHGRIISDYGTGNGGQRNDGINIAVTEGQPIRSAGDGVVIFSGDGPTNYGNLAVIRHDNGYATVYAHAENFIISKGDRVARGQVIGYGGRTGDVTSPQLHFEVRRNARTPIDPSSLLGPLQVASR